MPAISIKPNTELESPSIINSSRNVTLIENLLPIKPKLILTRPIRLPRSLNLNLMPSPSTNSRQVRERLRLLRTDTTLLDARVELVADEPDHAGRHVIVAAGVAEVGDELRDVVRLGWRELPVVLQSEGEAVEATVAAFVNVVLDDFRVVPAAVTGIVDLGHLQRCWALVYHVRHLLHSA